MKSFGIKRDENDPRWAKFIEWLNGRLSKQTNGDVLDYYGFCRDGSNGDDRHEYFDRIITLDEWESEFMQPKLAGREYDYSLLEDFKNYFCKVEKYDVYNDGDVRKYFSFEERMMKDMVDGRYAKTDRIAELKQQIEKLSDELKELEG